ncbi:hypothetical protein [Rhodoflexus sp.]
MELSAMLTPEEQLYYSRQLLLPQIGAEGQQRLQQARVLTRTGEPLDGRLLITDLLTSKHHTFYSPPNR